MFQIRLLTKIFILIQILRRLSKINIHSNKIFPLLHNFRKKNNVPNFQKQFNPEKLLHSFNISEFRHWKQQYACYFYSSNLHNCDPVIQLSAVIINIDDKLANDIRSMSSNNTITFSANENLSMEQEIVPSQMHILTLHFESTNPLHISRANIIAFERKPGQKESEYIQNLSCSNN